MTAPGLRDEVRRIATQYLTRTKQSGSDNLMAPCPFHRKADGSQERHPSFAISLTSGLYFCHSCKASGNLRQFLHAMGVSYHAINTQYGIVLDEVAKARPRPRCHTIMYSAIDAEFLPSSFLGLFDTLPAELLAAGYSVDTLQYFEAGFDSVNQRITFPLRDMHGNLLGISGRSVQPYANRFKVYDTEYARWGLPMRTTNMADVIWNIHNVYASIYKLVHAPLVVVEGFKGCMWVRQAGIENVVALCGSYLKEGQVWLLEHLGAEVYLMLDNDDAGQKGMLQAGDVLSRSLPVYAVPYRQTAQQPTDLQPHEVREALDNAMEFRRWKQVRHHSP